MEAVVLIEHMKDTLTLFPGEAKEMHGRIIHAEKRGEGTRFGTTKKMDVRRLAVTIGTSKKVEVVVGSVKIRVDANEATEVHEEGKVEIRYRSRCINHVKPLEGGFHIFI